MNKSEYYEKRLKYYDFLEKCNLANCSHDYTILEELAGIGNWYILWLVYYNSHCPPKLKESISLIHYVILS